MIKTKKQGLLIVLSGPSGSGKSTICDELKKKNENIWESISMTSRMPREGEIPDESYYFITKEAFEAHIEKDDFLEYALFAGNYYGTPKKNIQKHLDAGEDVILVIEIQGALQVKEKLPQALFVFLLPPSMNELRTRLTLRKTETEDKILERFQTAYREINELTKYNYVIVNDEVEKAGSKLEAIIQAEKCRVDRIEEVFLNTEEEKLHETLVKKDLENKPIHLN
ncbi:MAG: guanylate kinase [Firmicutes bacterium]|nr:guanylate kinase [Bacillota bacterium]